MLFVVLNSSRLYTHCDAQTRLAPRSAQTMLEQQQYRAFELLRRYEGGDPQSRNVHNIWEGTARSCLVLGA